MVDCEDQIRLIESEFENAKETIEELLKTNDKVGLVHVNTKDPIKMPEWVDKFSNFTIDKFLRYSENVIYWFTK